MLSNTLNTNEVKDRAGVEVEFERLQSTPVGRSTEFAQKSEPPNAIHRLKISHQETGSGAELVRRSLVRVDKTVTGVSGKPRVISSYNVMVIPVGDIANYDEAKNVEAELMSFLATTGAGTTVLFDCTGNGAAALIAGTM